MKRKFTSLAALVLSLLMAVPAMADVQSLTGVGDVVTDPELGQYYVIQGNAQHDNIITWLFDKDGALSATASVEVPTGPEAMKYVWTFEKTDNGVAAKNLTSGRYIFIEGTSDGGKIKMQDSPAYFTIDVNTETSEVAFKNASNQCIDMNYSGVEPVSWSGGATGSRRLVIYVAQIEEVTDLDAARERLNTCFGIYQDYLPGWGNSTFDRGQEIGQYAFSDEVYNAFVENLELALKLLERELDINDYTVEQIDAIIKNIEDGYNAIMESIVKLTIADGNYRIVSNMIWTQTDRISTGVYDENEQEIFEEVVTHPIKGMYATLEGNAMWATIDSTDCRFLWQLTNNPETGLIKMMNIATDGIIPTSTTSKQVTLVTDSETEMVFEYIKRTDDGKVVVAMKPSTGTGHPYLHCGGHSSGAGKNGGIVGWTAEAEVSQWTLEPVSDEEVQALVDAYAPIKNHELLVSMFQEALAEGEAAVAQAKDITFITERGEGLITSTEQFSSPYSETRENSSFDNVLSEDPSTFWHSDWSNNVSNHTHYFQVAFTEEPVEGNIQCRIIRRNVSNDHITSLGVFGSNDDAALEDETEDTWTNLGSFDLSKNTTSGKEVYSNPIELPEGYKYFRFYIDATTTGRGYGHFAYFQLYNLTFDGNTQWSQMGEAATAIETAIETAKAVDIDEVEMEDYTALRDAVDAFKAVLVDPSPLAEAIEANKGALDLVVVGENPGFWPEDSDVATLAGTLMDALAYLKSGAYTQAQIEAYAEAVKSGASDVFAAANPVEPGKWYAFKYDCEENFEAHGWNKDGATGNDLGDLWDNYAMPANLEDGQLAGLEELEEVGIGQTIRFVNEDLINEMDMLAFRFVAQGDSAYAIQHKSGLYLNGNVRSTGLTLGLAPALFNVKAVGYGKVVIEVRKLNGEGYYTEPVYLHAAESGHSLVTWNNDAVSSNSALYIEPIDESDFDEGEDVAEEVLMNVKPNSMVFMCYPMGFSVDGADIYAYQGAITESDNTANYVFNKIEQAEPGQPVLLVVGDVEAFEADDAEEELEPIYLTLTESEFAVQPLTTGGVHGTYAYEWVDEGTVVVGGGKIAKPGNTLVLAEGEDGTDCTRDVSANTGYIVYGENILKDADVNAFDLVITAGRPADKTIKGDLNGDGKVDIADAVSVLNIMAAGEYNPAADLNEDEKVDIADFVSVLNIMAAQ